MRSRLADMDPGAGKRRQLGGCGCAQLRPRLQLISIRERGARVAWCSAVAAAAADIDPRAGGTGGTSGEGGASGKGGASDQRDASDTGGASDMRGVSGEVGATGGGGASDRGGPPRAFANALALASALEGP